MARQPKKERKEEKLKFYMDVNILQHTKNETIKMMPRHNQMARTAYRRGTLFLHWRHRDRRRHHRRRRRRHADNNNNVKIKS